MVPLRFQPVFLVASKEGVIAQVYHSDSPGAIYLQPGKCRNRDLHALSQLRVAATSKWVSSGLLFLFSFLLSFPKYSY